MPPNAQQAHYPHQSQCHRSRRWCNVPALFPNQYVAVDRGHYDYPRIVLFIQTGRRNTFCHCRHHYHYVA